MRAFFIPITLQPLFSYSLKEPGYTGCASLIESIVDIAEYRKHVFKAKVALE